jgi:hypothetical protein
MFGSDAPEQKAPSHPPGIPSKAHLEARGEKIRPKCLWNTLKNAIGSPWSVSGPSCLGSPAPDCSNRLDSALGRSLPKHFVGNSYHDSAWRHDANRN